jgi:hypothetical protein
MGLNQKFADTMNEFTENGNGHVAFIAPGEVDRVEEFSYDEVDRRLSGETHPPAAPENSYRQAALKFLPLLDQILVFIMMHENPRFAVWVAAASIGRTSVTAGASQMDIAEKFSVTKAAVNKATKTLQAHLGNSIFGIEAMPGQRKKESCQKMARARNKQINQHPHNQNGNR